jgi:flagellar hook-length control protein FliK
LEEHTAATASSVQQEAAAAAAQSKTFASRYPPSDRKAKAAFDATVLGFHTQKAEDCRAGRKCSISREEWWKTYGHRMSAAKQQRQKPAKIMTSPVPTLSQ